MHEILDSEVPPEICAVIAEETSMKHEDELKALDEDLDKDDRGRGIQSDKIYLPSKT